MRSIQWYICSLFLVFILGCTFDDDAEFFPVTQQAFFTVQTVPGAGPNFIRIANDQIQENSADRWGVSPGAVGDFAVEGEILWISDLNNRRILAVDLSSEESQEERDLGASKAHFVAVGETYLCFADTLQQHLGFLHKKKGELFLRELDKKPGQLTYRSGKFYVQLADSVLGIFQEQSLSEINRLPLGGPIQSIQVDPSSSANFVYVGQQELSAFSLNFNTDALTPVSLPSTTKKVLHSTIDSPRFGKEVSGRATLSQEGLFILDTLRLESVEDVEVDFFDADVYFLREGGLFRRNIPTGEEKLLGVLEGNFLRSGFYIENIGN